MSTMRVVPAQMVSDFGLGTIEKGLRAVLRDLKRKLD